MFFLDPFTLSIRSMKQTKQHNHDVCCSEDPDDLPTKEALSCNIPQL